MVLPLMGFRLRYDKMGFAFGGRSHQLLSKEAEIPPKDDKLSASF
jgi:hypothetical protein